MKLIVLFILLLLMSCSTNVLQKPKFDTLNLVQLSELPDSEFKARFTPIYKDTFELKWKNSRQMFLSAQKYQFKEYPDHFFYIDQIFSDEVPHTYTFYIVEKGDGTPVRYEELKVNKTDRIHTKATAFQIGSDVFQLVIDEGKGETDTVTYTRDVGFDTMSFYKRISEVSKDTKPDTLNVLSGDLTQYISHEITYEGLDRNGFHKYLGRAKYKDSQYYFDGNDLVHAFVNGKYTITKRSYKSFFSKENQLTLATLKRSNVRKDYTIKSMFFKRNLLGKPAGFMHFAELIPKKEKKNNKRIFFQNIQTIHESKRREVELLTIAKNNPLLSPFYYEYEGNLYTKKTVKMHAYFFHSDDKVNLDATLEGFGRRPFTYNNPLILDQLMFYLIPTLEFDKTKTTTLNLLTFMLQQKKNVEIKYIGKETITIDKESKQLHKFKVASGKQGETEFWIDENRELIRILFEGSNEFIRSTANEASTHF